MTGLWIQFGFSLVAILVIAALVRLIMGNQVRHIKDEQTVRISLADDLPGFSASDIVVDQFGRAALAYDDQQQRHALVFVVGDKISARLLDPQDVDWSRTQDQLLLRFRDLGMPLQRLTPPTAALTQWLTRWEKAPHA